MRPSPSKNTASIVGFAMVLVLSGCGAAVVESDAPSSPSDSSMASEHAAASPSVVSVQPTVRIDVGTGAGLVYFDGDSAWVGAETGVFRIDPQSNEATPVIDGLTPPFGFNVGFGSAWISRADEDAPRGWIERYDLASGELVATIDVGLMPLETLTAFGSIWVPNHHSSSVSRIDPATNEVVATIEVEDGFGDPYAVAAGENLVWTTSPNGGHVNGIDPATNQVVEEVTGSGCALVAAVGRVWWFSSCEPGSVRFFEQADPSAIQSIDSPPGGMPLSDGTNLWAAATSPDSGNLLLTSLDPDTLEFGETLDTGVTEPAAWAMGFGTLWVSSGSEVVRIEL